MKLPRVLQEAPTTTYPMINISIGNPLGKARPSFSYSMKGSRPDLCMYRVSSAAAALLRCVLREDQAQIETHFMLPLHPSHRKVVALG